jgi:hypothetical protein
MTIKAKHVVIAVFVALGLSLAGNVAQYLAYRSLWYDAAQAEGMLDQAEAYIHVGGK